MNSKVYTIKKKKITRRKIDHVYVFFDNGDGFEIDKSELIDLSFMTYDKLIRGERGYVLLPLKDL